MPAEARNRSIEPEMLDIDCHRSINEHVRLGKQVKPNTLELYNSNNECQSMRVKELVPLETALLNMNEILKNLTLTAEKKVNFFYFHIFSKFK